MPLLPQSAGREVRPESRAADPNTLSPPHGRGSKTSRQHGGPKHNLPHPVSAFVGRRAEVALVGDLLGQFRLLTLTGPGGMGKTRLALEVASGAVARYPDGAWLVELGDLTDPSRLCEAVADALPGRDHRVQPRSADDLAHQIGTRRLLLVLDNCEHLVDPCARLVQHLMQECPALDVLATSREALGIVGEHKWTVGPLALPGPDGVTAASLATVEAGELFLQRATETSPQFRLTDATACTVAQICRRLDGMPLAIELAATRIASLSPADILDRLDDRFRLLNAGSPTAALRHQTLLATLEWSYHLLAPVEAALLRRVSVFAGWTLAAAEDVCAAAPIERVEVVDHLAALVSKSLVVVEPQDEGVRYHLLETIRVWADTLLEAASEVGAVRRAHAMWCVALAEQADEESGGRHPKPWLDRLDVEHDNLRAALEWARAEGEVEIGLRLTTALAGFWRLRGHVREGQRWLEWAVDMSGEAPAPLRARALRAAGLLRGLLGDVASALPLLEQSSALYAEAGDEEASLCTCNPTFLMFRSPRSALPLLREREAFCRRKGDTNGLAHLLHSLGHVHFVLGEADAARRDFEECVQLGRGAADGEALRNGLVGLARVDLLVGDLIAAEGWAAEARGLADDVADAEDSATALWLLGDVARARGRADRAHSLLSESLRLAREGGWPLCTARALYYLAVLAEATGDDEAGGLFEKSLSMARAGEVPVFHEVRCLVGLGSAAAADGDLSTAAGHFLEALEMAQGIGDLVASADALHRLSLVTRIQGKDDEALMLDHRALELYARAGALPAMASSLESLAGLAAGARSAMAARLLGAAQALRDPQGWARPQAEQAGYEVDLARVRAALGEEEFAAAFAEGEALSAEEAVAYAVRGRRSRDRPSSGWDSLTPAEIEVVRLVSQGLSNREVGGRLFISPRTVGHHLTHVFDKLGIRSRGALTKDLAGREL
ncbi:MAG: LuxR C-terminal-related transcriptional regulator [Acidimicrobiales bacterium]